MPAARLLARPQWTPAQNSAPAPPPAAPASAPGPTPTFSSDVKVVNVLATVRDKDGKIVRDLNQDDFVLEEDGRPQIIRYFSRQSDLPLTLGLLVDTSGSERRMLGTERQASSTFFDQVLRPDKDKAFLIHFDREVELLQDLTSSRERLQKALDAIDRPQWSNATDSGAGQSPDANPDPQGTGGGGYGGRGGYGRGRGGGHGGQHGGTALYDAVYLASSDLMSKQAGRKALVLLTDGDDRGSKVSLADAITSTQRADTLAYAIHIADQERQSPGGFGGPGMGRHGGWGGGGMGGPGGGYGRGGGNRGGYENRTDGKKVLQQLAKETGGAFFDYSKKKSIDQIYSEIEDELRNQYSLGYTSDQLNGPAFRKIQLTVKRKGLSVQSREGYYAA